MREIKFRGKNNGRWIYGNLIVDNRIGNLKCSIINFDDECNAHQIPVQPKTVGQYIGLKDKEGVEIYKDDIVDIFNYRTDKNLGRLLVKWNKSFMRFNFDQRYFDGKPLANWTCNHILANFKIKIIGNKYDNSELLEGE